MKNNLFIGIIISISLLILALIILTTKPVHLNSLPLNYNGNKIINNTSNSYYDTILIHSLEYLDIKNQRIIIEEMDRNLEDPNYTIKGAVGTLKDSDVLVVYLNNLGRNESLIYIPHEAIHIKQYVSKSLINISSNEVVYKNKTYFLDITPYEFRPWEVDAFNNSDEITEYLKNILIKK